MILFFTAYFVSLSPLPAVPGDLTTAKDVKWYCFDKNRFSDLQFMTYISGPFK